MVRVGKVGKALAVERREGVGREEVEREEVMVWEEVTVWVVQAERV
jgi:hypothetical protein